MKNKKIIMIIALSCAVVILLLTAALTTPRTSHDTSEAPPPTEWTPPDAYQISGVKPLLQCTLEAGCETYACTMLLQTLGFDIDEITFADKYVDCHYVTDDGNGNVYGPDMHSGFAGTPYKGWGVYAPSMAKSMNRYLKDQKSDKKATAYENIDLETLCKEYVAKDIPVMVWATTDMQEPKVYCSWIVDYVDENAKAKKGDTVSWYEHEHCLMLMGYDEEYYYFGDSTRGEISHFEKKLVEKRYKQMESQCIIVE